MPRIQQKKEATPLKPTPELIATCKVWIGSKGSTLWAHKNIQERNGLQEAAEWLAAQICGVAFIDTTGIQSMSFATDVMKAVKQDADATLSRLEQEQVSESEDQVP